MTNKVKILYVEDDAYLRYVTRDNLEIKGYQVIISQDGEEAWEAFQNSKPDLCILDVMLPKLDGFSLAKLIRQINVNIPIIFLTAKSLKEDKIEGLTIGGDDYITNPYSIEELILKIEIFLKRSKVYKHDKNKLKAFSIGNYNFSPATLDLSHSQISIRMTQKEAELLQLFHNNQNRIVKRDEILNAIWGEDDYFKGRSLDVFISRLRKYLSKDSKICIENIHGIGFRLILQNADTTLK